jgi:hypothetical protein
MEYSSRERIERFVQNVRAGGMRDRSALAKKIGDLHQCGRSAGEHHLSDEPSS